MDPCSLYACLYLPFCCHFLKFKQVHSFSPENNTSSDCNDDGCIYRKISPDLSDAEKSKSAWPWDGGDQQSFLADFLGTISENPKLMLMLWCMKGLAWKIRTSLLEKFSWMCLSIRSQSVCHRLSKIIKYKLPLHPLWIFMILGVLNKDFRHGFSDV